MKDLYQEIRQIELDQREELIGQIARKLKASKPRVSFASAMHRIAEKENEPSNLIQNIDFVIDTHLEGDLASENLAEMWG